LLRIDKPVAGGDTSGAEQLKRALADVKVKQKRVVELEGQLHTLQQQVRKRALCAKRALDHPSKKAQRSKANSSQ